MRKNKNVVEMGCKINIAGQDGVEIEGSASEVDYGSFHDKKLAMARASLASVTHFKTHDGELIPIDEFADYINAHQKKS